MKWMSFSRLSIAGWMFLTLVSQGCVSSRGHQQAMDQKDSEIRALREERASLKSQIQRQKSELDSARGEVAEAGASFAAEPAAAPESNFPELDSMGISYGMRDGNMVISIPSSITFASGQATLSKEGQKALQKVATTLKKEYPGAKYGIEGHTDSDPIKKSKFSSNRDLSIARAMAVLTYLVEECKVPDDACVVAGHGQYDPVQSNKTEADKAKNRRVEIVVHQSG
ncbi:MAG: flagellar motor protein MotB [Planctomycetota bacterium]